MQIGDKVRFFNHQIKGHDSINAVVVRINATDRVDIKTEDGFVETHVPVLCRSLSPVSGYYCHKLVPVPLTHEQRIAALEATVALLISQRAGT